MALTANSTGSFLNWQSEYAAHRIPTFPIQISPEAKKPLVSNYSRFGLPASAGIARKFPDATAIGFMAGKRVGLTILDVDTTDERVLGDAMDRHGPTPVIVRSGSGHYQAWYRHNGEGRSIRPFPKTPIDILGGGLVVAPPSQGIAASYQFIEGGLDDLDHLPVLQNINIEAASPPLVPLDFLPQKPVKEGERNTALWRYCMREAHYCDDREALLDVARTRNDGLLPPLDDDEVVKITNSAWSYTVTGQNRLGQHGARMRAAEVTSMAGSNPHAFALLEFLRVHNGPNRTFMVANALADKLGWTRDRFVKARSHLEGRYLEMVRRPRQNTPAMYRWRKIKS